MTRSLTLPWLLACAAAPLLAQETVSTDRYTLDVPPGWKSETDGGTWVIKPGDDFGVAGVGGVELAGQTHTDAQAGLWARAKQGRTVVEEPECPDDKDPSGRTWKVSAATIQDGGASFLMVLVSVELSGRVEGFLIVCSPEAWEREHATAEKALYSVRAKGAARPGAKPDPGARPPGAGGGKSPLGEPGPGKLAGVYTATVSRPRATMQGNQFKLTTTTLVLFADGSALWKMPAEGLAGFQRVPDPRLDDFWGRYGLQGARVTVTQPPNTLEYELLPDGSLERRYVAQGESQERAGERYVPRKSPDGRAIDGELRREGAWDPILAGPGCRFAKDGTFQDEGLIRNVLPQRPGEDAGAYAARCQPGVGRYRVEAWTLILDYADGRQNRVSWLEVDGKILLDTLPVEPKPRE